MPRKLLLAAAVVGTAALAAGVSAFAADDPPSSEPVGTDPVARIALAGRLTEYGRKAKSPATLIDAAVILRSIPAGAPDATAKPVTEDENGKAAAGAAAPANALDLLAQADLLLVEAKDLAAKRAAAKDRLDRISTKEKDALTALADAVQAGELHRGASGGPKYYQNGLKAGQTDTYNVKFNKGQWARVAVRGQPGAAIYLTVVNHAGTKRSDDKGQNPVAGWMPHQNDGVDYKVKVKNSSPGPIWYQMYTN
jgi:hypothetical protein